MMVPVAVVGLAGRFPGADSPRELWRNLSAGDRALGPLPAARERYWDLAGLKHAQPAPALQGGFLREVERFDCGFFGLSPAEAALMDPQQRIFLEEAWRAFEDAGYSAESLSGRRCAVFVGSMMNEYHDLLTQALAHAPKPHEVMGAACFIPGRVAYHLDLRGPAIAVDTASSASLVAVHLACRALQTGEADLALAGGVNVFLTEKTFRVLSQAGILSPAGECRPFDDAAQGTLPAEAVAAVVLKRLADAERDGDAIYGVIRASGVNQAGRTPGITAPSVESQLGLMREVYAAAEIDPATVQYVEAHGTGTLKGDPIEAEALAAAFGSPARGGKPCRLGSIKANLGHAFSAAGVGSLIKVLGALHRRELPRQIGFSKLNRHIDAATWPFELAAENTPWARAGETPRRAAVSGVGLTGTNCHCVLEEAPEPAARSADVPARGLWIALSARTPEALRQRAADLHAWLRDEGAAAPLIDMSFTLCVGRTAFGERAAFLAHTRDGVAAGLAALLGETASAAAPVIFRSGPGCMAAAPTDAAAPAFAGLGAAWAAGARIDWAATFAGLTPRRLHLPTYPFSGDRIWYDMTAAAPAPAARVALPAPLPAVAKSPVRLKALASAAPVAATIATVPAGVAPAAPAAAIPAGGTRARLRALVAQTLFVPEDRVRDDSAFTALGLDSILAVELTKAAAAAFGVPLSAGRLYDFTTVGALADHIDQARGSGAPAAAEPVSGFAAAKSAPFGGRSEPARDSGADIACKQAPASRGAADPAARIRELIAQTLFIPAERVTPAAKFTELGLDSILAVELVKTLQQQLGLQVPAARLYDFPTVGEFTAYLAPAAPVAPVAPVAPAPVAVAPASAAPVAAPTDTLARVTALTAATLFIDPARVVPDTAFAELGLDSILAVELAKKISAEFGTAFSSAALYDHGTPRRLAALLAGLSAARPAAVALRPTSGFDAAPPVSPAAPRPMPAPPPSAPVRPAAAVPAPASAPAFVPVAVIGYAGRFPGARDADALWALLRAGKTCLSAVPEARAALGDVPSDPDAATPRSAASRWGGFLDGVDEFDAVFFNLSPAEAERMDPQQRIFLQVAWHALEHAGYAPESTAGRRCGIAVGISPSDYGHGLPEIDAQSFAGNSPSVLPARLAYLLNWHGPCLAVDTACASFYTALDLACASLGRRETDVMLAGGVHVMAGGASREAIADLGILSPTGAIRSFDAAADGWVLGEAAGAVILKRLDDAERDGDCIHAVIRACGVGQDGAKNGLLAPYSVAQAALQRRVLAEAGVAPAAIGYVELHGTGIALSDEVELLALQDSFRGAALPAGACALSTLKPNIGHAMAAAGATSFIKVLLGLRAREIAPIAGLATAEPVRGPFALTAQTRPWPAAADGRRRALVNGQSALGANGCAVLEDWPAPAAAPAAPAPAVFVLSAHTVAQLQTVAANLDAALADAPDTQLGAVAFTLQTGRRALPERLAFVAGSMAEARAFLQDFAAGRARPGLHRRRAESIDPGIALLVDGPEGAQFLATALAAGSLDKLARLWVHGVAPDWTALYRGRPPRRVPLPVYPFSRDRYWLQARRGRPVAETTAAPAPAPTDTLALLLAVVAKLLRAAPGTVTPEAEIARTGFNSLHVLRTVDQLAARTGRQVPAKWFFECRTFRELAARIDRELPAASTPVAALPAAAADAWPLSEGQRALWSIAQRDPADRAYHVPVAIRWPGPVDAAALERALRHLALEQPALRLRFVAAADAVQQRADAPLVPLRREARPADEAALLGRLRELSAASFDLETGPPWRACLLEGPGGAVLHLVFHHLAFDGHSLGGCFERLEQLYAAFARGETPAVRAAAGAGAFVAREAAYLASPEAAADRAFWLARFPAGFAPLWPATGEADTAALHVAEIPQATAAALGRVADGARTSVQSVLLTAWLALLADETGRDRAVTAVAADLRTTEAEMETAGYFVNLLPVGATVRADEPFAALGARVFAEMWEALARRRYPFRRLARALAEQAVDPVCCAPAAGFYFQPWFAGRPDSLAQRLVPEVHQTGEFPLAAEVIELAGDWRLNVKYRTGTVAPARAAQLAARFGQMLATLAADPAATVGTVLGRTAAPAGGFRFPDGAAHELIARQAARTPAAPAACFESATLTYSELETRANRLAHHLIAQGVRPGELVAVALHRSLDLLVGLLAVWKAGGAYVPVDPAYPAERCAAIVGDSGARFFLTHDGVAYRPAGVTVVACDRAAAAIAAQPASAPVVAVAPAQVAYVIYTSGSTGRPKGVQVSHRNLVHFLSCMADRPGCTAADRVLALTTVCFDIAALELFLPLATGACVEIASEAVARSGTRLKARLEAGGITLVQATPATWKMLLAAELGPIPQVRALCGGEAWDTDLATALLARVGELWNMYGPTETTVWSSVGRVLPGAPVRLGEPVGNTQFYVLDEAFRPVPRGEVGELYIGGDGVALGYHNNPAVTDERFVRLPHLAAGRLYRTGDLVRHV